MHYLLQVLHGLLKQYIYVCLHLHVHIVHAY